MSDTFTTDIYPRLVPYLRKCLGADDEQVAVALVLAWWIWENTPDDEEDYPVGHYGRLAVRAVRTRRDLPGVATNNHQPDALDRKVHGGSMEGVRDRSPGPDAVAEQREEVSALYQACLHKNERVMLDMLMAGDTQRAIARRLGYADPHRVIVMKRRLAERLEK